MPFFTPPKEIEEVIDSKVQVVVPVIASFNINGGIKPLYFKYNNMTISIFSVRICKNIHENNVYECSAEYEGYLKDITLTYWKSRNLWTLNI